MASIALKIQELNRRRSKVCLVCPQDLANGIPRHVQVPHDPFHRLALNVKGPTHPRDRIHPLYPSLRPLPRNERSDRT
jgi:hypothetical protein